MKYVRESLNDYYEYSAFKMFEADDEKSEKSNLQAKEKAGLAAIEKAKENFEDFKKSAKGDIKKWKEFWEETKLTKEAFDEQGSIYQMWDSDYVIGVLELPASTLSDGSLDGGFGADDTEPEVEEEIIEGPDLQKMKPSNELTEAIAEDDLDNLDLDPGEPGDMGQTELGNEPTDQPNSQQLNTDIPNDVSEIPSLDNGDGMSNNVQDEIPNEEPIKDEPKADLNAPQIYFVVYDNKGEGREEILRCGSNNVVKAFNAFYNDTFKGSMKDIIIQYKTQKETLKKEAEKSKKEKVEKEKDTKLQKFLGGSSKPKEESKEKVAESFRPKSLVPTKGEKLNESYSAYNKLNEATDFQEQWLNEVYTILIEKYEMNDDEASSYISNHVYEQLMEMYAEGIDSIEAAEIVVTNESAIGKLYEDLSSSFKEQFNAGDIIVDSEGTEWEVRSVSDRGYKLRGVDNEDAQAFITFSEAEEFDFVKINESYDEFSSTEQDNVDEYSEFDNFKHSLNVILEDENNPLNLDEEIIYDLTVLINSGDIDDTIERLFDLDTDPIEALEYLMNDNEVCDILGISCEDSIQENAMAIKFNKLNESDDSTKDEMIARWEEMREEGYDLNSIANEMGQILGNPDTFERILDIVEEDVDEMLDIEDIVTQIIEEFEGETEHREDVYHGRSQTY